MQKYFSAHPKIAEQLRKKAEKPRPSAGVPYATPLLFYHDWDQSQGAPSPRVRPQGGLTWADRDLWPVGEDTVDG